MSSMAELMGQEIYDLIYVHYDRDGNKIDDPEDILYCEESDIDQSRIEPLKRLLVPVSTARETLIPIEAAKLLAAWGDGAAVEYFEYCIDSRIDRLGNLEPDRLHGYDVTYELITDSLLKYYARCSDRSESKRIVGLNKIMPLILKILLLAKELPYNMSWMIPAVKRKSWRFCEQLLKECFIIFLEKKEKDRNDYWNIIYLKLLFQDWDPQFLVETEDNYGVIDIPASAQDRL